MASESYPNRDFNDIMDLAYDIRVRVQPYPHPCSVVGQILPTILGYPAPMPTTGTILALPYFMLSQQPCQLRGSNCTLAALTLCSV